MANIKILILLSLAKWLQNSLTILIKIKVNRPLVIHCSAYALINESSLYHVVNFKVLGAHGFTDSLMMKVF